MHRVTVSYWTDELGRWMRCGTHDMTALEGVLRTVIGEIDEEDGTGSIVRVRRIIDGNLQSPVTHTADAIRLWLSVLCG